MHTDVYTNIGTREDSDRYTHGQTILSHMYTVMIHDHITIDDNKRLLVPCTTSDTSEDQFCLVAYIVYPLRASDILYRRVVASQRVKSVCFIPTTPRL